ncbi:MAG: PPOX class F420-dependent oxidoreductase [Thermomicrobiales bacterium]|jgi:PPOX class probable F420-dependent enzyme
MSDVTLEQYADLLQSAALAHIATIGPKGEPQSSPLWFGWDGEFLRFAQLVGSDRKRRNLERDPRVAISIVDPANIYRYVEVRGVVERIEPDVDRAFINAMAQKYWGQETYTEGTPDDEFVVVVIRPVRVSGMG